MEKSCKNNYIHTDLIEKASRAMPSEENINQITLLFKILGDQTRTKILSVLSTGELCVCDISKVLNMTKSAISHQLKTLRLAKLIKSKKIGKEVYYSLADSHVEKIYKMAMDHVLE